MHCTTLTSSTRSHRLRTQLLWLLTFTVPTLLRMGAPSSVSRIPYLQTRALRSSATATLRAALTLFGAILPRTSTSVRSYLTLQERTLQRTPGLLPLLSAVMCSIPAWSHIAPLTATYLEPLPLGAPGLNTLLPYTKTHTSISTSRRLDGRCGQLAAHRLLTLLSASSTTQVPDRGRALHSVPVSQPT